MVFLCAQKVRWLVPSLKLSEHKHWEFYTMAFIQQVTLSSQWYISWYYNLNLMRVGVLESWYDWSVCKHAKLLQSWLTFCDPMDHRLPGSSVHGILQARILEWVALPFSRGSSQPGIEPTSLTSPALAGRFFTTSASWEAPMIGLAGLYPQKRSQ